MGKKKDNQPQENKPEESKPEETKTTEKKKDKEEGKKKDKYVGKQLGADKILSTRPKTINGREYIEVKTDKGTTFVLSETDLKKQIK